MDAHLWPALNTALIDWSTVTSQEVKVKTDIDLYYYLYMLKFSLNHKLSISEYGKVEKALTQEYTIKHPGRDTCWLCKLNYFIHTFITDTQTPRSIQFNKFFCGERDNTFTCSATKPEFTCYILALILQNVDAIFPLPTKKRLLIVKGKNSTYTTQLYNQLDFY